MKEIGELLKSTREESGVTLEEASNDLEIKTLILENIEDGNIGCFKDIFLLKEYIHNYSKYLGLEPEKIIDEFNEYLFEYTSKIPLEDIEKAMQEQKKEETQEVKIVSPYTTPVKTNNKWVTVLFVILAILVFIVAIWALKQIIIDSRTTNMVSYISK